MANEFIARKGLIALEDSVISGSLNISGSVNVPFGSSHGYKINTNRILSQTSGVFEFGALDYKSTYPNIAVQSDNTFRVLSNGSTLLYVTGSGNVGIGTTSPALPLHVDGDARITNLLLGDNSVINTPVAPLHIKTGGTNARMRIEDSDGDNTYYDFYVNQGAGLYINEGSTTRLFVSESGNVGIGTTSPALPLHVVGSIRVNTEFDAIYSNRFTGLKNTAVEVKATNTNHLLLNANSGGNVGIGTTSPSYKLTVGDSSGGDGTTAGIAGFYGQHASSPGLLQINYDTDGGGETSIKFGGNGMITGRGGIFNFNTSGKDISFAVNNEGNAVVSNAALYISSSGDAIFQNNVGIGTTSPQQLLDITDTDAAPVLRLSRDQNINSTDWAGESLGDIEFYTNDPSNPKVYGKISVIGGPDSGTPNSGYPDGHMVFFTAGQQGGNLSEKMRITDEGNVGIGTTSPASKLHVEGTINSEGLLVTGDASEVFESGSSGTQSQFYVDLVRNNRTLHIKTEQTAAGDSLDAISFNSMYTNTASPVSMVFRTGTNNTLMVSSNNRVGIGTTSPGYTLDVNGVANFRNNANIAGDLTVDGIVTAQEFHTDFVSASIIYQSGSTKFGDSVDDKHEFTGSLEVFSGSLTFNPGYVDNGTGLITMYHGYQNAGTQAEHIRIYTTGSLQSYRLYSDTNAHTQQFLLRNNVTKVAQSTYWPTYINNDAYASRGGLLLGSSTYTDSNHSLTILNEATSGSLNVNNVMYVSGSKVSIGTTTSPHTLNVKGTISRLNASNIQVVNLLSSADHGQVQVLNSSGVEKGLINSNGASFVTGDFGIGINSPGTKLDVADSEPIIRLTDTRNLNVGDWDDVSLGRIQFYTSDTTSPGARTLAEIQAYSGPDAASGPEAELRFKTSYITDSSAVTRMVIDSQGRVGIGYADPIYTLQVSGSVGINDYIYHNNDGNTYVGFGSNDSFRVVTGNTERLEITDSGVVINDPGNSTVDFRVESDTNTHMLFVDASSNRVGIGTSSPQYDMEVSGSMGVTNDLCITHNNGSNPTDAGNLYFREAGSIGGWGTNFYGFRINHEGSNNLLAFQSANLTTVRNILTLERDSGDVGIGTLFPAAKLDVVGSIKVGANSSIFSDGSITMGIDYNNNETDKVFNVVANNTTEVFRVQEDGKVGIGTTTPSQKLTVSGNIQMTGNNYVGDSIFVANNIYHSGDTDTYLNFTTDRARLFAGGVEALTVTDTNIVVNEGGVSSTDFRVESDTETHMLFVDAGSNRVGIGTSSPSEKLHVSGGAWFAGTTADDTQVLALGQVEGSGGATPLVRIYTDDVAADNLNFHIGRYTTQTTFTHASASSSDRIKSVDINGHYTAGGSVQLYGAGGIGGVKTRIGADLNTYFIGSNVGIGTTTPSYSFHVDSGIADTVAYFKSSDNRSRILISDNDTNVYVIAEDGMASFGRNANLNNNNLNVNASGNVGIGNTNPEYKLDIQGDSPILRIADDNTVNSPSASAIWMGENGFSEVRGAGIVYDGAANSISLVTSNNGSLTDSNPFNASKRLTVLESNGFVGIGTTAPGNQLDVVGTIRSRISNANPTFNLSDNTNCNWDIELERLTNSFKIDQNSGGFNSTALYITGSNGNVGIGTTDPRYATLQVQGTGLFAGTLQVQGNLNLREDIYTLAHNGQSFIPTVTRYEGGSELGLDYDYVRSINGNNGGNVGIGTTSPGSRLTVHKDLGSGGTLVEFKNSNATYSQQMYLSFNSSKDVTWSQGSSSGGTIIRSGTRGINLETSGSINLLAKNTGTVLFGQSDDGVVMLQYSRANNGEYARFDFDAGYYKINTNDQNGIKLDNDVRVTGDLTVDGIVTAQEFHTEFVSASIVYESGSTKFGDTSDDVHQFTGSIKLSEGNLTLPDGTSSNLALNFSSSANTGIYIGDYDASNKFLSIRVNGTNVGTFSPPGISSHANVYTADNGQFRNYGGVWKATTGTAGGDAQFILNGKTIMHLDEADERVGIGTTTPAYNLDVYSSTNGMIRAYGSSIGRLSLQNSTRHFSTSVQGSNWLFYDETGGAERMRIDSAGNVGIGTTSPSQKLTVAGNIIQTSTSNFIGTRKVLGISAAGLDLMDDSGANGISIKDGGSVQLTGYGSGTRTGTAAYTLCVNSSGYIIEEAVGAGTISGDSSNGLVAYWDGTTSITGSAGFTFDGESLTAPSFVETSARKFKENIEPIQGALEIVNKLEGVTFNRIGEEKREYGFIADEVQTIAPELTSYDDNGEVHGVHYARTVAILTEAVKELDNKVKTQELFIKDLVSRIEKLENK